MDTTFEAIKDLCLVISAEKAAEYKRFAENRPETAAMGFSLADHVTEIEALLTLNEVSGAHQIIRTQVGDGAETVPALVFVQHFEVAAPLLTEFLQIAARLIQVDNRQDRMLVRIEAGAEDGESFDQATYFVSGRLHYALSLNDGGLFQLDGEMGDGAYPLEHKVELSVEESIDLGRLVRETIRLKLEQPTDLPEVPNGFVEQAGMALAAKIGTAFADDIPRALEAERRDCRERLASFDRGVKDLMTRTGALSGVI